MKELIELIKKLVAEGTVVITTATVVSVNKDANTCVVTTTGTEEQYNDVLLQAVEGTVEKPCVTYPKVNSVVGIVPLFGSKSMWMVFMTSEVEEIHLNGDEFGGLVKAAELKAQATKNSELLTAILGVINSAVPIMEAGNGSPSALQAALKTAVTGKQVGDFNNLENPKVKHG